MIQPCSFMLLLMLMVQPVRSGQTGMGCRCSTPWPASQSPPRAHHFFFSQLTKLQASHEDRLIQSHRPLTSTICAEIFKAKWKRSLEGLTPAISYVPYVPMGIPIRQIPRDCNSLELTTFH